MIYFKSQGFHLVFMPLQSIDFEFFVKILEGNYVLCCGNCTGFDPTSHHKVQGRLLTK